ncbi:sensor domain-containing protein [Xanthomonas sacchari]|uniref:sensor domain-containing protein n=1 Tax=Xanthomonas sacchari TaxID=56458 RepID=UPI00225A303C|nr:diguanylate cyclase [Xanthomonas sacchari]MCW0369912.1 hypothetical protein [Xanthomonas sacchari]
MQRISPLNIVDLLLDAVCIVEPDSTIVFVSPAFERIFGYTPQEVTGKRMLDMVHPDDLPATRAQADSITEGALQLHFENRYIRKDGRIAHIRWTARWVADYSMRLAVAHDITERKSTEALQAALYGISEAAHTEQTLESLCSRIHQIIGELLPATNFSVALYDASSQTLRFPYHADEHHAAPPCLLLAEAPLHAEVIRTGCTVLRAPYAPITPASGGLEQSALAPQPHSWLGVPLQTPKGVLGLLVLLGYSEQSRYTDKDQALLQFVSTQVAAAVERKQTLERLQHMAQYDHLTQLPNRHLFLDRLETALAQARRARRRLSLLFIDLDRFKDVNDTLGHAVGDLLLQRVAGRLLDCVRASDTVARLGGDEFVVLIEGCHSADHATATADRILAVFGEAFDLDGHHLHVLPSIGVAFYPDHGDDAHSLLVHADGAMYRAKKAGGNRIGVASMA